MTVVASPSPTYLKLMGKSRFCGSDSVDVVKVELAVQSLAKAAADILSSAVSAPMVKIIKKDKDSKAVDDDWRSGLNSSHVDIIVAGSSESFLHG